MKEFLKGMVVGLANIIPGVSGGTLAVILGIYDRIIALTKKGDLKKDWQFLLKLILGIGFSILLCSLLFDFLFEKYAIAPSLVFFGIILGSLPLIGKIALGYCEREKGRSRIPAAGIAAFSACFLLMVALVVMKQFGIAATVQSSMSVGFMLLMFLCGILAAVSMVLPGISGSLMMVVIGVYPILIAMLAQLLDFSSYGSSDFWQSLLLLIPFGLGCLLGIWGGLSLVRKLLEKNPAVMYLAILGLVAGSLFAVFPFSAIYICRELYVGVLLALLAALGTYIMSKHEV